MTGHRFVMPYARPNYELPIADWFEEPGEEPPPVAFKPHRPTPHLYRQTGAK